MRSPPDGKQSPTIYDIGQRAGVAPSTVSKVLGKRSSAYPIAPETRERILAAARELGYELDPALRGPKGRRTGIIGVIYGTDTPLSHGVYEPLADHLGRMAAAAGYRLEFYQARTWDEVREVLSGHSMDGCLMVPFHPEGLPDPRAPLLVPTVILNDYSRLPVPQVVTDDDHGIDLILEHLIGLGHRRIMYADIASRPRTHASEAVRRDAFATGMQRAELPVLSERGDPAEILDRAGLAGVTAIITYNNQLAVGLIPELRRRGIAVPFGMSLVCATDISLATLIDPGITAINVPMTEMAEVALRELQAMMHGAIRPGQRIIKVPQALTIRGSTAAPRA